MSTRTDLIATRLPLVRQRGVAAAVLAGAVALGGALAIEAWLGLALIVGAGCAALLWYDLRLAVAVWVVLVFLEAIPVLNAAGKAAGAAVGLGWLVSLPQIGSRRPLRDQAWVLVLLGLLWLWLVASLAWTVDVENTASAIGQWSAVGVAFVVIATAMADRWAVRLGATAFAAGAMLSVLVGAAMGDAGVGEEGRFRGALGDPNILAAALVPAGVLVVALAAGRRGAVARGVGAAAVAVLGTGLAASGSRGGLVGALAAVVAALVVSKRHRAALTAASVVALAAMLAAVWLLPSAWERSSSAGPGSGRRDLWLVAWHMAGDYPLTGVGLGNYPELAGDYVREVGPLQGVDLIAVDPHDAHNLYLQLLAETGVVGLALFIAFATACLGSAWRAAQRFDATGEQGDGALARAVLVAGVGILVSEVFISAGVDRRLWVVLALGPALLAAARRDPIRWMSPAPSSGSPVPGRVRD